LLQWNALAVKTARVFHALVVVDMKKKKVIGIFR